jgi:hypothetical protein
MQRPQGFGNMGFNGFNREVELVRDLMVLELVKPAQHENFCIGPAAFNGIQNFP